MPFVKFSWMGRASSLLEFTAGELGLPITAATQKKKKIKAQKLPPLRG